MLFLHILFALKCNVYWNLVVLFCLCYRLYKVHLPLTHGYLPTNPHRFNPFLVYILPKFLLLFIPLNVYLSLDLSLHSSFTFIHITLCNLFLLFYDTLPLLRFSFYFYWKFLSTFAYSLCFLYLTNQPLLFSFIFSDSLFLHYIVFLTVAFFIFLLTLIIFSLFFLSLKFSFFKRSL